VKSEKTILIFGAGINQLELIREAKALGVITIVIDPQDDPPGKADADFFYTVAGNDYETTKTLAKTHRVNGIVTGQMEKPLRLMARLAKDLGLNFNLPEVIERCIDKWLMKETFIKHSVPCAQAVLLKAREVPNMGKLKDLVFPLIMKPRDSFSSRGVYRINTIEELYEHLEETQQFASNGDVIVEEFIDGKEYSVETITYKGETSIIQFTEKYITPFPNTVEMGHLQPADLNEMQKENIRSVVISAIQALGIDNSAAHSEVMIKGEDVRVIEVGARLGGDFIASYLTKASTGVSMDRAAVQVALGDKPDIQPIFKAFSMIKYLNLPVGKQVLRILPMNDISNRSGLVFSHIFVKPGDLLEPITHSALRPACLIVKSTSKNELLLMMENIESSIEKKIILQ
jgi:biotin carboxylase